MLRGGVYPRVCGGTGSNLDGRWSLMPTGLSPRVRGNPAGWPCTAAADSGRVYPRVCGGTATPLPPERTMGSIPACAGEPAGAVCATIRQNRSIPACAGEPHRRQWAPLSWRGLSPRVRGNPRRPLCPAAYWPKVYPRVCGGTSASNAQWRYLGDPRSIPACAGEPRHAGSSLAIAVYPRVCGGTRPRRNGASPRKLRGLSPRVRGNPACRGQGLSPRVSGGQARPLAGSIPACAGEPRPALAAGGLWRSIPACAGEPRHRNPPAHRAVYPRVCGGTRPMGGVSRRSIGRRRSIPACAGEPRVSIPRMSGRRVYPRVCGGTWSWQARGAAGVYPRVCGGTGLTPRWFPRGTVYPRVCGGTRPALLSRRQGSP